jgi:hypothetical protein
MIILFAYNSNLGVKFTPSVENEGVLNGKA